jgi:hypothetical protein
LQADEVLKLKDEMDYEDPFLRSLEKGREILMLGILYEGTIPYYQFEITYASQKKAMYYVNANTMMIDFMETDGAGVNNVQQFIDYETLPNGIVMPRRIRNLGGEIQITSIQTDTPLDEKLFSPSEKNRYTIVH